MKPTTPLKEPLPEETTQSVLDMCRSTQFFSEDEMGWIEQTLTRPEIRYDGFAILEELFAACSQYHKDKDKLPPWEVHRARRIIRGILHSRQIVAYKQRNVLVAVPQRIQHPKHAVPCLHGFAPGQHIHARVHSVFGMDYAEARNALVKAALSDDAITHVLFVDDDILMPRYGLAKLLEYNLPIVSGTYVKKSPQLETGVTAIGQDDAYLFSQQLVPYEHGNTEPIVVSCTGGGFILIDVEVFQKLGGEKWYEFIIDSGPAGDRVRIGEDSLFCQKAAQKGIKTAVVPGLCALHVDFTKGGRGFDVCTWGPSEIVDPATRRIRPEFKDQYLSFPDDPDFDVADLVAPDKIDFFGKNTQLKAAGLIK
jgi:hypothetical protein